MHKFYYNECLPSDSFYIINFAELLGNTIAEFDILVNKNIGVLPGIILEKEVSKTINCGNILKDAIISIPNKEKRTLAFSYFTKYPIQYCFNSDGIEDHLLEEDFCFEKRDATNLAIAKYNDFFLFSVAIDEYLKNDTLQINGKNKEFKIDNLYGENKNTNYIESQINNINGIGLDLFNYLKHVVNKLECTSCFEKAFKSEKKETQETIISLFKRAKERKLKTPFSPDTNLIKDVSPDKNKKNVRVFELREKSDAVRIYFYELDDVVYISHIGHKKDYKKDSGSAQSKDIQKAINNIEFLVKTRK